MTVQSFLQRGAKRASFEADKLQRTLKVQNTIGSLRTQIRGKVTHLGETALRLYRQGALVEEELKAIGQAIEALEAHIAEKETELAQIKAETFPEEEPLSAGQPGMGSRVCPNCGQAIPVEMRFCIHCGAPLPPSSEGQS
ncbi:MAG TPA: zinc ribbon domain-containing protein [Thermoflexia bacterium]|nr:zinc ribbon domain-containing protein [Thermoflexia bacterium]